MRRSGKGSGGGLGMYKNVQPRYRTGGPNRAINPGGVGQIGASQGTHITTKRTESAYRGDRFYGDGALNPVKLGNELASQVERKPGGSREIFKSGSQHGTQTRSMSKGRSFDD